MKRAAVILLGGLILAGAALAEDLAPGVVLLAAIKRHMGDSIPLLRRLARTRQRARRGGGTVVGFDRIPLDTRRTGRADRETQMGQDMAPGPAGRGGVLCPRRSTGSAAGSPHHLEDALRDAKSRGASRQCPLYFPLGSFQSLVLKRPRIMRYRPGILGFWSSRRTRAILAKQRSSIEVISVSSVA